MSQPMEKANATSAVEAVEAGAAGPPTPDQQQEVQASSLPLPLRVGLPEDPPSYQGKHRGTYDLNSMLYALLSVFAFVSGLYETPPPPPLYYVGELPPAYQVACCHPYLLSHPSVKMLN